ncbi:MAG: response regulator [Proteobacteria bacterium]|nr:response regulator [Pseudomonadota bacterium]
MEASDTVIKILIIDNNAEDREFIRKTFSDKNYSIESVDDGDKALEATEKFSPNLIFVNPNIDGLSGAGLCAALRTMELEPRPSIVLIVDENSSEEDGAVFKLLESGADDIVAKPFTSVELSARARSQLNFSGCYNDITADNKNLKSILEITNAIGDTLDTAEILNIIVNHVARVLDAYRCSIVLVGEGDKGYVLVSHEAPEVRDLQIDLGKYPEIREVIRTRAPLSVDDVKQHPLMEEVGELVRDLDYTSVLVVPWPLRSIR